MQTHYDDFFEDIFIEMEDKYGEIEEMNVCDNLGDHLVGNVYVKVSFISLINEKSIHRSSRKCNVYSISLSQMERLTARKYLK